MMNKSLLKLKKKLVKIYLDLRSFVGKEISERRYSRSLRTDYRRAAEFISRNSTPPPPITVSERREIDEYWKRYGVKFPDYTWFQMYYHVTGIHSPRFLVNIFVHSVLYKYYNLQADVHGWDDKNIYERLNRKVKFPTSLAHKINGRYYDSEYSVYDNTAEGLSALSEKIFAELQCESEMIIKESKDSSAGKGVRLAKNIGTANDVKRILVTNDSQNYIIQKKVIQHPFFSQFCSTSVNIVRIMSWRDKNEVKLFPATIRYGVEGKETDVSYKDGKEIAYVVGVNEDGTVNDVYMSFDGAADCHPKLVEKQIPNWQLLQDTVKKAHEEMFHFDFIGWDFTIDQSGNPICIEYNIYSPGTILYQFANGPLAGKYTEEFLAVLQDSPDLIPRMFRYKKRKYGNNFQK